VSDLARVDALTLGDIRVVRISGEVDLSNAHEIMAAIGREVPGDASSVLLDLSDTAYIDSAGISMLFRLAERLRYRRQELRLVVPANSPIRAVLEITSVPQVIPVQTAMISAVDPT
jgi:anti-anti-sigma factor